MIYEAATQTHIPDMTLTQKPNVTTCACVWHKYVSGTGTTP